MFDAVVVGGGAAGLSAALILGRARRRTLVVDGGLPRNAPSAAAHSVFTRDGTSPGELLRVGRDQLQAYPSVQFQTGSVVDARAVEGGFEVEIQEATVVRTRRILLAHGVVDELPQIDGMAELWGKSVLHCPYCHGWEVRDQPLALYGRGTAGVEFVELLLGWSRDLALCTDGPAELDPAQREILARHNVAVWEQPILRLDGRAGVLERIVFKDGTMLERRAIFVRPSQRLRSDLSARLGCEHTELGLIRTDELGQTSVAGVYAAGDAITPMQQVIRAAATGAAAAAALNHSILKEEFVRVTTQES